MIVISVKKKKKVVFLNCVISNTVTVLAQQTAFGLRHHHLTEYFHARETFFPCEQMV